MIAIAGGGLAGLATAYQLACDGVAFTLFEASDRLGGIVETVQQQGFVIECGPDSWVTEKPWARELAVELGLDQPVDLDVQGRADRDPCACCQEQHQGPGDDAGRGKAASHGVAPIWIVAPRAGLKKGAVAAN